MEALPTTHELELFGGRLLSRTLVLLTLLTLAYSARPSEAQSRSSCADCHFANPQSDPNPAHLMDWESSAHGREGVGCEKCHQGDESSFESFLAHRGILASRNPASPTHESNLPKTCGVCHTGPFVAFQKSPHYDVLDDDQRRGATCSTCHGSVAAELLSPRRLEQRCLSCHGQDGRLPQPEVAVEARVLLEETINIRRMLDDAEALLRRVGDDARKQELQDAWEQAEVPLLEAVANGHAFVFDPDRERLRTSRERTEALLNRLANPQSP